MALSFPHIDPVAVAIGPFAIRWYALAYIAGIALAWLLARYLVRDAHPPKPCQKDIDDVIPWAMLGIIVGGRLGYVLFYDFARYVANPLDILALWQGGMSFHGGLLGVGAALILFARARGLCLLSLADVAACVAPIGLFLGRVANFVNAELYGRVTDVPWGIVFPGGGPSPRHPSQLYEAVLEGPILLILILLLARFHLKPGILCGAFLCGYGCARAFVELFREPDAQIGLILDTFSMGQLLSAPMIVAGFGLIVYAMRRTPPIA